jgi:class III poly(R)-hydroxyalkanoic acid synthase PhaE subunit
MTQREDTMDWSAQAWADAQQQFWEAWRGMIGTQPSSLYTQLFEQWRELAAKALENWTGGDSTARQVAEQLLISQTAMMRFVEMTANAWAEIAPKIEQGQDWQEILQAYGDQMRQQFSGSYAGMTRAGEDISDLWALYLEEWQRLSQPWMEPLERTAALGTSIFTAHGPNDLLELTNLYWDAFERTFGSLLQSPGLGLSRELNEKIARGFDRWLDYRRASADYQNKLADVWGEAFEQLLAELSEKRGTISSIRDLLLLWGQGADRVFIKTFQTDEYVQIQGQFLNAAMAYRVQQREIMEIALKAYDIPTRSEVDEAHRNIYELRKEIKALRKQIAEMQKSAPPSTRRQTVKRTSEEAEA